MQRIPIWVRGDPFTPNEGWRRKADSFRFEDPGLRRKKLFAAGKGSPGHHIRREKIPFLHPYGGYFEIHSDHQPLKYLLIEAKGVPVMAASRIQRWAITLSVYEYTLI